MNQELLQYIQQQLHSGATREQITNILLQQGGWNRLLIDAHFAHLEAPASQPIPQPSHSNTTEYDDRSGHGEHSTIPEEIRGWSWGAFLLTWIWGAFNKVWISFLMFVPLVNFIMWFVLGAKGNKWAWQNKRWRSVEHFKKTQKKWAIAGLFALIIPIIIVVVVSTMVGSTVRNAHNNAQETADHARIVQTRASAEFYFIEQGSYEGFCSSFDYRTLMEYSMNVTCQDTAETFVVYKSIPLEAGLAFCADHTGFADRVPIDTIGEMCLEGA